jgi:hypothetical protein
MSIRIFVLSKGTLGTLGVVSMLAMFAEGIGTVVYQHHAKAVPSVVCTGKKQVVLREKLHLTLNCGGKEADTDDPKTVLQFVQHPEKPLRCTVYKDDHADCIM